MGDTLGWLKSVHIWRKVPADLTEATVAGGTAAVEATVAGGRAIVRQLSFDSSPRAERVLKRRVANGTTRDELL